MNEWLDWKSLNKIIENKKNIFFFGRSEDWIPKTYSKIKTKEKKFFILDNNKSYQNKTFMNCKIFNPNILEKFDFENDYVIITAEPDTIVPELLNYNLEIKKNFCCTPEIKDWGKLQEIRKCSKDLIFSSSDYFDLSKARSSKLGGGIFIANISNQKYEKKIDGQYRQMTHVKDNYYVVEFVKKEVHIFDKNFKILQKYNLDQTKDQSEKPNYCGIVHVKEKNNFYVANAATDEISVYDDKNFKFKNKIIFSNKSKQYEDGQCHINDVTNIGKNLFVSYFSRSGLWKKGIFDGGVSEIELDNDNSINDLLYNLAQPHSPEIIDGQIYVLDSYNKYLYHGTKKITKFQGFVRGLAFDEDYFYVGQSEDMYLSRDMGSSIENTICNAGIYQLDTNKNISRFLSTPDIMNIHDILLYK